MPDDVETLIVATSLNVCLTVSWRVLSRRSSKRQSPTLALHWSSPLATLSCQLLQPHPQLIGAVLALQQMWSVVIRPYDSSLLVNCDTATGNQDIFYVYEYLVSNKIWRFIRLFSGLLFCQFISSAFNITESIRATGDIDSLYRYSYNSDNVEK